MRIELLWSRLRQPNEGGDDVRNVFWIEVEAMEHIFESGQHFPGNDKLHGASLAVHVPHDLRER